MTTTELIAQQFGGFVIPLEAICDAYLGMGIEYASKEAGNGRLPLIVFKLRNSKDAPWLTTADLLAQHINDLSKSELACKAACSATNLLHDVRDGSKKR